MAPCLRASERADFSSPPATRLAEGDEVRVTLDVSLGARALSHVRKRPVTVRVSLRAGEKMTASCEGFSYTGEICEAAKSAPLSEKDICACFEKTDALPFAPTVLAETDEVFVPKSVLNAFRRAFYEGLAAVLAPDREPLDAKAVPVPTFAVQQGRQTAVIVTGKALPKDADIVIWKAEDMTRMTPPAGAWLYLPPLLTGADEAAIAPFLDAFAGVYCEGTYGIPFARKYHKKLFLGRAATFPTALRSRPLCTRHSMWRCSKELTLSEQDVLAAEGTFALSAGDLKVMDLCYCPFGKTCKTCDKRTRYTMTDASGRAFPLRRYRAAEGCRFEVYNCAPLAAEARCPRRLPIVRSGISRRRPARAIPSESWQAPRAAMPQGASYERQRKTTGTR